MFFRAWQAEKEAWDYCNNGYLKEKKNEDVITVGEAIDNYMLLKSNVLSPSTLRGYRVIRRTRLQSLMDVDVHKVNSFELQKAINEDAARIGHKSLIAAKSLVSAALKLYEINTDWNVTLPPKKPIRKNLPSAQLIIDAIKGTDMELPCLLAMWLAMRMSEVTGLKFKDIDENGVYVNRSLVYAGKGDGYVEKDVNKTLNSTRQVPLSPYLMHMIEQIPHKSEDDYIIQMNRQTIYKHYKKLIREHGIDITFHDLRHMSASVMVLLGIPDKYAMERGGWSTTHTLKRIYQHTFSDEREMMNQRMDDYFETLLEGTPESNDDDIQDTRK